jgi:hypothetical protein
MHAKFKRKDTSSGGAKGDGNKPNRPVAGFLIGGSKIILDPYAFFS